MIVALRDGHFDPGGSREVTLAMEKNEVQGICGIAWETHMASVPSWIIDGKVNFITQLGLSERLLEAIEIVDTNDDPRYREYWQAYFDIMKREGVTQQYAKIEMRRRGTLIAAMMLRKGEVDGQIGRASCRERV